MTATLQDNATACDYALSDACTCGVSPMALTADQMIRVIALRAAMDLDPAVTAQYIVTKAQAFETYIRGENP